MNLELIAQEVKLNNLKTGSKEWFDSQRNLIIEKPLLKHCYNQWYLKLIADEKSVPQSSPGKLLELGSGGSLLKSYLPELITSDVVANVADLVVDARRLPFKNESLRAIFMTHVFHHIPDIESFLNEATRTLVPGGVISMIEVAHTPLARFFFKNFHPEPFNDSAKSWTFHQNDSMMDANQALSWIVLVRDSEKFKKLFPNLQIECFVFLPWLSYLFSGGVTRKALLPNFFTPLIIKLDSFLKRFDFLGALHWHIRIRKT